MKIKHLLTLFVLLNLPMLAYSQATVGGVVTYFFNKTQGDKPDLGAKVIFIDSAKIKDFDYDLVQKFASAKAYRNMYISTLEMRGFYADQVKKTEGKKSQKAAYDKHKASLDEIDTSIARYKEQLIKNDADTDEKYKALDEKVARMLIKIRPEDHSQKTIDAAGNYSFNVTPGIYYVFTTSKNRTGLSVTEISGKVHVKKVKVGANESKDVSYNFDLY